MKLLEKLNFWSKNIKKPNVCPGVDVYVIKTHSKLNNPHMYKEWGNTPFEIDYCNGRKTTIWEDNVVFFPNPLANMMMRNYERNLKLYGKDIATSVRGYRETGSKKTVLTLFPNGAVAAPDKGSVENALTYLDDVAKNDFIQEYKMRHRSL